MQATRELGLEIAMNTLPFETFWNWLIRHPNCILRAGAPDVMLFDDEEFHWHFGLDGDGFFVQVIRGKRLVGEIAIDADRIAYVQESGEEPEGEHVFEAIIETENERAAAYFFVLVHAYEDEGPGRPDRAVH